MDSETDQPTYWHNLTPELIRAVLTAAEDQGAASRALRATCWHLRTTIPATFVIPVQITLCECQTTGAARTAGATAKFSASTHDQCRSPPLHLWEQQQQQGRTTMQLTSVHLQLGPGLAWCRTASNSNATCGRASKRSDTSHLPDLLIPRCPLLQRDGLLKQLTSLAVTYEHCTCAILPDCQRSMRTGNNNSEVWLNSSSGTVPASSWFSTLLSSATLLSTVILQPMSRVVLDPMCFLWEEAISQHSSWQQSSTCSSCASVTDRPCLLVAHHAPTLNVVEVMSVGMIGRSCLPQLLQLQHLKRILLPVVLLPDEQQQYTAIHPDIVTPTEAEGGTEDSSNCNSTSSLSPVEVLELLLVPAMSVSNLPRTAAAAAHDICTAAGLLRLLQPLTMLQQLQQLHVTVLSSGSTQPAAVVAQLAGKLKKMLPGLRSFSLAIMNCAVPTPLQLRINRATWNFSSNSISSLNGDASISRTPAVHSTSPSVDSLTQQRAVTCQQLFGAVPLVFPVWQSARQTVCRELQGTTGYSDKADVEGFNSDAVIAADAAPVAHQLMSWTGLENEQQQQLVQLRHLSLCYAGEPHLMHVLPRSCLKDITCLQLAVPQTLLPHLTWLLPEPAQAAAGATDAEAAATLACTNSSSSSNSSNGGGQLWGNLRRLELALGYWKEQHSSNLFGDDDNNDDDDANFWQVATHQQQQRAVQALLGASCKMQTLKLEGSSKAGVSLVPNLKSLAEAASGHLQELQVLHTLPFIATEGPAKGCILHLADFTALQKLHLSRGAVSQTEPLVLQLLPTTLHELYLEGFSIVFESLSVDAAALTGSHQLQHDLAAEEAGRTAMQDDSGDVRPMHVEVIEMQEKLQGCSLDVSRSRSEAIRSACVMPHLRHLSLVNGYIAEAYFGSDCLAQSPGGLWRKRYSLSVQQLLVWAGPKLRSVELSRMYDGGKGVKGPWICSTSGSLGVPALPSLPELRSFKYVNSNLGLDAARAAGARPHESQYVSDILGYLQASAPELQHLELILCNRYVGELPVVDKHVPALLNMGLRSMRLYIGGCFLPPTLGMSAAAAEQLTHQGPFGTGGGCNVQLIRYLQD